MVKEKITLSVIKADVGRYVGHTDVHPEPLGKAESELAKAKSDGLIIDFHRGKVGDDIALIMTHRKGPDNSDIHRFAWETFEKCTEVARKLGQYGAGQDLLPDAFSGNVQGMGPGMAEMEFVERNSEPVLGFLADKTAPEVLNYSLYKIFCDPFNTIGLIIDAKMHKGFNFEVDDLIERNKVIFSCPE